jgi:hypothetical protein
MMMRRGEDRRGVVVIIIFFFQRITSELGSHFCLRYKNNLEIQNKIKPNKVLASIDLMRNPTLA